MSFSECNLSEHLCKFGAAYFKWQMKEGPILTPRNTKEIPWERPNIGHYTHCPSIWLNRSKEVF